MLPRIELDANLTDDPVLRVTGKGTPVCNLRVAATKRGKRNDKWVDLATVYLNVVAWDRLAEQVNDLAKGDRIFITGELRQDDYDGQTRYEVHAKDVWRTLTPPATRERPQESPDDPWETKPPDDPWATTSEVG